MVFCNLLLKMRMPFWKAGLRGLHNTNMGTFTLLERVTQVFIMWSFEFMIMENSMLQRGDNLMI